MALPLLFLVYLASIVAAASFENSAIVRTFELGGPKALVVNGTVNIVLETLQTRATKPWPAKVAQADEQALKFSTNLFVVSPYSTAVQRTKLR